MGGPLDGSLAFLQPCQHVGGLVDRQVVAVPAVPAPHRPDERGIRGATDAVLSGHGTKCFFTGTDDLTTLKYLTTMLGHEDVARRGWSHDVPSAWGNRHGGRRSVSESTQREEFAPPHTLREMIPGEAVLFHGTLPPIHLTAIRHWEEPELAALVRDGADRTEQTCPLTSDPISAGPHAAVDIATLEAAKALLPKPNRQPPKNASADPTELPGASEDAIDEEHLGTCISCGEPLGPGGWQPHRGTSGGRRCAPNCHERRRSSA